MVDLLIKIGCFVIKKMKSSGSELVCASRSIVLIRLHQYGFPAQYNDTKHEHLIVTLLSILYNYAVCCCVECCYEKCLRSKDLIPPLALVEKTVAMLSVVAPFSSTRNKLACLTSANFACY
jgi:hypothetical protein